MSVTLSQQNNWTDLNNIWYKDSPEPEKGHMLVFNAKKGLLPKVTIPRGRDRRHS